MASLTLSSTLMIFFFTFLCYSDARLIDDVCSEASNPPFCIGVLQSDPRAAQADLRGLGQIMIEKSAAGTNNVMAVAKSFPGGAADVCVETCDSSIDALNKCSRLVRDCGSGEGGCKYDFQVDASAAQDFIVDCEDAFSENGRAPPAQLKAATKNARDLISILLVIASRW